MKSKNSRRAKPSRRAVVYRRTSSQQTSKSTGSVSGPVGDPPGREGLVVKSPNISATRRIMKQIFRRYLAGWSRRKSPKTSTGERLPWLGAGDRVHHRLHSGNGLGDHRSKA